jgi:hypothetical protein
MNFFPSSTDFSFMSKFDDALKQLEQEHHWLEAAPKAAGAGLFLAALRGAKNKQRKAEMVPARSPSDHQIESLADEIIREIVHESLVDELVHEIVVDGLVREDDWAEEVDANDLVHEDRYVTSTLPGPVGNVWDNVWRRRDVPLAEFSGNAEQPRITISFSCMYADPDACRVGMTDTMTESTRTCAEPGNLVERM